MLSEQSNPKFKTNQNSEKLCFDKQTSAYWRGQDTVLWNLVHFSTPPGLNLGLPASEAPFHSQRKANGFLEGNSDTR